MRICIVSPYFTPFVRSSEYYLAQTLTEFGHDVTILTSTSKAPREAMVTGKRYEKKHNFEVKYLKCVDFDENPIAPSVFFHVLRDGYNVVMLREDYPIMCHLAFFASKARKIPTILTTERTYYPTGLKGILLRALDATVNKILREGVSAYTAHCSAAVEFSKKKLGTSRAMVITPAGVDSNLFRPLPKDDFYLEEGNIRLFTVARLHKYKGLQYLIKAFEKVVQERKDAKLYILGKGPEERALKRLAMDLGVDDKIVFISKPIPNTEMPRVYTECDIYVQPSVIEPFGIAVLEAMACGKPVVGTRIGGMLDIIVDGKTGFLVPPADASALSKAILKLVEDRTLLKKMGENAREEALQYDWNIIAKRYLDLINKISNQTKR